ncbi:oligosaccharyltransferase complex subunit ostc [Phtheirospermum japonicum]|uniref:Oligosaccharyltransferase complex subunit ostc n=1 Tax=Phtheirospermum japonicum TaxID=374723 RepID=A0A830C480_9LAMI|nr:oligosaccharyltransferase complex subunit ostc [Phtheirospermum japonicum]
MTLYSIILLTYFMVVSRIVYDVIVEPPSIGSMQDRFTGAVKPDVSLPGRVNGQYIIDGFSSGFMFVFGGVGIMLLDLALDKNQAKSVKVSYASAGVAFVLIFKLHISMDQEQASEARNPSDSIIPKKLNAKAHEFVSNSSGSSAAAPPPP